MSRLRPERSALDRSAMLTLRTEMMFLKELLSCLRGQVINPILIVENSHFYNVIQGKVLETNAICKVCKMTVDNHNQKSITRSLHLW